MLHSRKCANGSIRPGRKRPFKTTCNGFRKAGIVYKQMTTSNDDNDGTETSDSETASHIMDDQLKNVTDLFNDNFDESDFEGYSAICI